MSSTPTATMPPSALPVPVGGDRGGDRRDDREARSQVARQPVAGDQQEQHGSDTGEQQGGRRREAGEHGHQERGAEHRHHVLGAQPEGASASSARSSGATTKSGSDRESTGFHIFGVRGTISDYTP